MESSLPPFDNGQIRPALTEDEPGQIQGTMARDMDRATLGANEERS